VSASTAREGAPSDIEVRVVRSLTELDAMQSEWDQFVDAALPGRSLFYHVELLRALAPVHLTGRRSLFVLLARRAGRLVGGLPLVLDRKSITRAGVRVLSLWASDGTALSLEGDVPVLGDPEPIVRAFRRALQGELRSAFDVLQLGYVRADSRALPALRSAFGDAVWSDEPLVAHTVQLPATLEAYRATRSGAQLRKLAQRRRKLATAHEVTLQVVDSLAGSDLEAVLQLHTRRQEQLSARGRHREFIARDAERRVALLAMLAGIARLGAARHHLLRADGRVVAFVLTTVYGGTVITGATAIDDAFAEYGPGTMVFWDVVETAFARGDVQRIEFGPGTTSVKQVLGTHEYTPQRVLWVPQGRLGSRLRWVVYQLLVEWRVRWVRAKSLQHS
jgi:CelD/BcsL family acetyltransferase involved in cellulose biosynthesis